MLGRLTILQRQKVPRKKKPSCGKSAVMSYSANDNQNFFVAPGRTTSRVVAQPGGQCSISLGGWTPEELEGQRKVRESVEQNTNAGATKSQDSTIAALAGKENNDAVEVKVESPVTAPVVEKAKDSNSNVVSSNVFASSANTNSFNVITDRPTSRVTRPPGGHCSIVLG